MFLAKAMVELLAGDDWACFCMRATALAEEGWHQRDRMVGRNLLRELAMAAGHYQGSRRAEFEVGTYLENRCRRSAGRRVAKKKMIPLGIEP